jgi:hypothetical protein
VKEGKSRLTPEELWMGAGVDEEFTLGHAYFRISITGPHDIELYSQTGGMNLEFWGDRNYEWKTNTEELSVNRCYSSS